MFIGHYGPAVWDTQRGRAVPIVKLWEAFLAVQAIDLTTGVLIMFGLEGTTLNEAGSPVFHIPWSHSLVSSVIISLLAAAVYKLFKPKAISRAVIVIALLAFSHWVLDLIAHRPDLPIYPGGETLLGLGLWDFPWIAFGLEATMLAGAFLYWQRLTTPTSKRYDFAIWALFLLMTSVHFMFVVDQGLQVQAGTFDIHAGPEGPVLGIMMVGVICLFAFLIALIERGRPSKFTPAPPL